MPREIKFRDLSPQDRRLVEMALEATSAAYAPYSQFAVGAAARTPAGKEYAGANFENAAYGVTMCAEVSALAAVNMAGDFDIEALAVVGHSFSASPDASMIVTPCGRCRQLIAEVAQLNDRTVRILCCNGNLSQIVEWTISELLPDAFGPHNLGLTAVWRQMRETLRACVKTLIAQRPTE